MRLLFQSRGFQREEPDIKVNSAILDQGVNPNDDNSSSRQIYVFVYHCELCIHFPQPYRCSGKEAGQAVSMATLSIALAAVFFPPPGRVHEWMYVCSGLCTPTSLIDVDSKRCKQAEWHQERSAVTPADLWAQSSATDGREGDGDSTTCSGTVQGRAVIRWHTAYPSASPTWGHLAWHVSHLFLPVSWVHLTRKEAGRQAAEEGDRSRGKTKEICWWHSLSRSTTPRCRWDCLLRERTQLTQQFIKQTAQCTQTLAPSAGAQTQHESKVKASYFVWHREVLLREKLMRSKYFQLKCPHGERFAPAASVMSHSKRWLKLQAHNDCYSITAYFSPGRTDDSRFMPLIEYYT